ncbi:hypothetical protein ACS768_13480 [Yersinia enterocolitica]|uniref:hypothetical protein n=1 Tax=Yersinia enterocolitica TaxID=630 RepID=UPI003F435113
MLSKDRVKYYTELPSQPFETGKSVFMYEVRQMAAELLSLREQLAELKALPPVGYVGNSDLYALSTGTLGCIAPYNAFEGIPLFTASKPAED